MDSETSISYTTWEFCRPMPFFAYFDNFSLRMRSLDHITTSGLKSYVKFEFSAHFSTCIKTRSFGRATPFSAIFVTIMSAHAQ